MRPRRSGPATQASMNGQLEGGWGGGPCADEWWQVLGAFTCRSQQGTAAHWVTRVGIVLIAAERRRGGRNGVCSVST